MNENEIVTNADIDLMDIDTTTMFRDGATDKDLFPTTRLDSLAKNVLKKLGMERKIVETNNGFLFFYHLILPICNTEKSGI